MLPSPSRRRCTRRRATAPDVACKVAPRRFCVGPSSRTVRMIKAPITVPSRVATTLHTRCRGDVGDAGSESLDPLTSADPGGRHPRSGVQTKKPSTRAILDGHPVEMRSPVGQRRRPPYTGQRSCCRVSPLSGATIVGPLDGEAGAAFRVERLQVELLATATDVNDAADFGLDESPRPNGLRAYRAAEV